MDAPGKRGALHGRLARVAGLVSEDEALIAAVFILAIVVGIIVLGHVPEGRYSLEARERAAVAGDVLSGLSRGREALVGSVYWPPLPTVAVALLALVPFVRPAPILGCVVSGISAALLAIYMNRLWAKEGVGALVRYPSLACLLFLPPVAVSIQLGQSTMVFVALVVCGWGFLISWLRGQSLRDLAYSGVLLGLAISVRYRALLIVVVALVVVALAVSLRRRRFSAVEGTCLTFLVPGAYVVLLWLGGNWLILGNPIFFLRGLSLPVWLGGAGARGSVAARAEWGTLAVVAPLVLSVPIVSLMAGSARGGALRHAAAVGGLVLSVLLVAGMDVSASLRVSDPAIPSVVKRLEERYPNGVFVVTGYEGYEFMEAAGVRAERRWVHVMRLKPRALRALLDAVGDRDLYLVVSGKRTERWEEVGLDWTGVHSRIPERFMFADRIDSWVLFECLRN